MEAEREFDEPTLIFLDRSTTQSSRSLDYFCSGLARNEYKQTYAIFETPEAFLDWSGDPDTPCRTLEHCESTKNFAEDIGTQERHAVE